MDVEKFSNQLIEFGVAQTAQDLYILPKEEYYELLFRKGGNYWKQQRLTVEEGSRLIARYKYLGGMDVSEKRKAQLGAISYDLSDQTQRLRLSTVGDFQQRESLVIRFVHQFGLSKENYLLQEQVEIIFKNIQAAGLYLFCGPVGSGKTTLMYRLAKQLPGQVITIEDPVEIVEGSFLQLQTNLKIQQTYDELIRLSLRHHPDVLIIGEIRDTPTALGAIRAALTGHRVFATLHTSRLEQAVYRMHELGCEQSLLEETLKGVVYQRLFSLPDKETSLLACYHFYGENSLQQSWEESIKEAQKRGVASEIFKER